MFDLLLKGNQNIRGMEVCPSWPTKKAHWKHQKFWKSPQLKTELKTGLPKLQNKPEKPMVKDKPIFVLA